MMNTDNINRVHLSLQFAAYQVAVLKSSARQ